MIEHARAVVVSEVEEEPGAWDDETEAQVVAALSLVVAMRNALPGLLAEVRDGRGPDTPIVVPGK